jgi:cellulose biosynthesis protein BcsQ
MIITVYNFKGGQGKSKIALNLAITLGYGIITNDEVSSHDLVLPEERIFKVLKHDPIPHNFKSNDNIIYDLGGFIDDRVIEAIKISDYVLVPVTNENDDDENIRVSVQTIDSIECYNKNIVILANKTELKKSGTKVIQNDFQTIKDVMNSLYQYPVFDIKKSKAVSRIAKDKISIRDMMKEGGITAYSYSDINKQFDDIIEYLSINKH